MKSNKLEPISLCVDSFFDPRKNSKGKAAVPIEIKRRYILLHLQSNWSKICGPDLAKNCWVENITGSRINDNVAYINTCSSQLANELFMMQPIFLKKINDFLEGKEVIKKLVFHAGKKGSPAIFNGDSEETQAERNIPWKERLVKLCPICSAHITESESLCIVCERKKKEALKEKLSELLRLEPWLTLSEVQSYFQCDPYIYGEVLSILKTHYFERVRKEEANDNECLIAVLLLTGKTPDLIDENIYNNSLAYLRGKK